MLLQRMKEVRTKCQLQTGEPKTKSRFWSKKNWNFESKIKVSRSLVSNFGVSNRNLIGIKEIDFELMFEIKFWAQNIVIVIEF